jgi:hypothetical protein
MGAREQRQTRPRRVGLAFASAWARLQSRFLKLECWQTYQESEDNQSQAAYDSGDIDAARELLRREAQVEA